MVSAGCSSRLRAARRRTRSAKWRNLAIAPPPPATSRLSDRIAAREGMAMVEVEGDVGDVEPARQQAAVIVKYALRPAEPEIGDQHQQPRAGGRCGRGDHFLRSWRPRAVALAGPLGEEARAGQGVSARIRMAGACVTQVQAQSCSSSTDRSTSPAPWCRRRGRRSCSRTSSTRSWSCPASTTCRRRG